MANKRIKQIKVYENNDWTTYDIGPDISSIGFNENNILKPSNGGLGSSFSNSQYGYAFKDLDSEEFTLIPSLQLRDMNGILQPNHGGTGLDQIKTIRTNLASNSSGNALANDIGVTGILPMGNGGTGNTDVKYTALSMRTSGKDLGNNAFTLGVTGTWNYACLYTWGPVCFFEGDFQVTANKKIDGYDIGDLNLGCLPNSIYLPKTSEVFVTSGNGSNGIAFLTTVNSGTGLIRIVYAIFRDGLTATLAKGQHLTVRYKAFLKNGPLPN